MSQVTAQFNHYRRCHVCATVTEHSEQVQRCDGCGKSIIPFFYIDESVEDGASADSPRLLVPFGKINSLWGLTAVWTAQDGE